MCFHCTFNFMHANLTQFHMKSFPQRLVLKKSRKATSVAWGCTVSLRPKAGKSGMVESQLVGFIHVHFKVFV